MERMPFGVAGLDTIINGGGPPGSVVVVAGEAGAGAREFIYTSAVMNGLALADEESFDLHYGPLEPDARLPDEIHYVSFTASEREFERELERVISEDVVAAGTEAITFLDLSAAYFQLSPVPRSWYAGDRGTLAELGKREDRRDVLEVLGESLDANAAGNLVLVDSLSDLAALGGERLGWSDIALLVKGLRRAARSWDGLILLLVDRESITDTEFGLLTGSADGTFVFEWTSGGNDLDRSMVVKEFRGVLPELEEEDIVRFETEITEDGFDITDIRKIR